MPTVQVYIKREIYDFLDSLARRRGVSVSTVVREIVESWYAMQSGPRTSELVRLVRNVRESVQRA